MICDYTFKIPIFGDVSTGKEELLKKYAENIIPPDLTTGVEFYSKTIILKESKIIMQLWEFSGEERFRFLIPTYCLGSNGAIIIYDITNHTSLDHLPEWTQIIREHAGDIPIVLIGNKFNLEKAREVSEGEISKIVEKYNLNGFVEISTKTGENVKETFEYLVEILINYYSKKSENLSFLDKMSIYDYTFKILTLGDDISSISAFITQRVPSFFKEDFRSTFGVDFYSKTITFNEKKIKLQLWPFSSLERFRFLYSQYCKVANGAFFLFDITNQISLDHLPEWTQLIRENAGDIPIVLIGDKFNLEKAREVSEEEISKIVEKYNLNRFDEISTKTGENVEETFEYLVEILLGSERT